MELQRQLQASKKVGLIIFYMSILIVNGFREVCRLSMTISLTVYF